MTMTECLINFLAIAEVEDETLFAWLTQGRDEGFIDRLAVEVWEPSDAEAVYKQGYEAGYDDGYFDGELGLSPIEEDPLFADDAHLDDPIDW